MIRHPEALSLTAYKSPAHYFSQVKGSSSFIATGLSGNCASRADALASPHPRASPEKAHLERQMESLHLTGCQLQLQGQGHGQMRGIIGHLSRDFPSRESR